MNFLLRSRQYPNLQLAIGESLVTVGRSDDNTLAIDDQTVSRHHAVIQLEGGAVNVTDLGSTSGTFVNGERIQRAALGAGDVIRFGDSEWQIEAVGAKIKVSGGVTVSPPDTIQLEPNPTPVFPINPVPQSFTLPPDPPSQTSDATAVLPKPQPRGNSWVRFIFGLAVIILVLVIVNVLKRLPYNAPQSMAEVTLPLAMPHPGPLLMLQGLQPDSVVTTGQPVSVMASASAEEGVKRLELWSDGELVDAYDSPLANGSNPLVHPLSWRPTVGGSHTLIVRSYDADGDVSVSNVIPVVAAPESYAVQPGDTWDTIADATGFDTEELQAVNTDPNPTVGDEIILPTTGATEDYTAQAGESVADIARELGFIPQDILAENPGLSADEALPPGAVIRVPIAIFENFGGEASESVGSPPATGDLLSAVEGFQSLTADKCGDVKLIWGTLKSAQGYNIYSVAPNTTTLTLMEESSASAISTVWTLNKPGQWEFYIAGLDNTGREGALAKTTFTTPDCDTINQTSGRLDLRALDIKVTSSVDRIYAYVRLGGSQNRYQRIPQNPGVFLTREADGHFRADSLPSIDWPGGSALPIEIELWGWAGTQLSALGTINATITPEDWRDGSVTLETAGVVGTLKVVAGSGGATAPTSKPVALPPPDSIQFLNSGVDCVSINSTMREIQSLLRTMCNLPDGWKQFTTWQWPPAGYSGPATEADLAGFQFQFRLMDTQFIGGVLSTEYIDVNVPPARAWATMRTQRALAMTCGVAGEWWLRAVGKHGQYSDWAFQMSVPGRACNTEVTVTFLQLDALDATDDDNNIEAYSEMVVGPHYWNPYVCHKGKVCSTEKLKNGSYEWNELTDIARKSALAPIPVHLDEGENLPIFVQIRDRDKKQGDVDWCIGSLTLPAATTDEWVAYTGSDLVRDEQLQIQGRPACRLSVRIQVNPNYSGPSEDENLGLQGAKANYNGCTNVPDYLFEPACNNHDVCYNPKFSGRKKEDCDNSFFRDMSAICLDSYATHPECLGMAESYYVGVVMFGHAFYNGGNGGTNVLDCYLSIQLTTCLAGYGVVDWLALPAMEYVLQPVWDCCFKDYVAEPVWDYGIKPAWDYVIKPIVNLF